MKQVQFLALAALLVSAPAFALGAVPGQIVPISCDGINCTICDVATVAQNVLNTGIYVAVFLSAILFAWAGWLYLTNVASPDQIGRARSIFFNVLVGLVIILAAWLIIDTLMRVLVNQDAPFGPWNKIC